MPFTVYPKFFFECAYLKVIGYAQVLHLFSNLGPSWLKKIHHYWFWESVSADKPPKIGQVPNNMVI